MLRKKIYNNNYYEHLPTTLSKLNIKHTDNNLTYVVTDLMFVLKSSINELNNIHKDVSINVQFLWQIAVTKLSSYNLSDNIAFTKMFE